MIGWVKAVTSDNQPALVNLEKIVAMGPYDMFDDPDGIPDGRYLRLSTEGCVFFATFDAFDGYLPNMIEAVNEVRKMRDTFGF